jgi:hypothetical protein
MPARRSRLKVPSPTVVLAFAVGLGVTLAVRTGGEPSSLRAALWSLVQLGLVAVPFAAGLNLLVKDRRPDALVALAAWTGAALAALVLG